MLFIILLFFCFQKDNQKSIKVLVVASGLLVGILFFNYILIFSGKTFYDGVSFWISSLDLKTDTAFILVMIIVFVLSYIFGILSKRAKIAFAMLIAGFVFCGYRYFYKFDFCDCIKDRKSRCETKQLMYKTEKMYRFYELNDYKEAYLPLSAISDKRLCFNFDYSRERNLDKAIKKAHFPALYYYGIYEIKEEKMIKTHFVDDKIAFKLFHDAGGNFMVHELHASKFTRLLDKDFVLGKK